MIEDQVIIRHPKGRENEAGALYDAFFGKSKCVDYITAIGIYGVTFVHEKAQITVSSREFSVVRCQIKKIIGGSKVESNPINEVIGNSEDAGESELIETQKSTHKAGRCKKAPTRQNEKTPTGRMIKAPTYYNPPVFVSEAVAPETPPLRVRIGDGAWRVPEGAEREGAPGTWATAIDVGQKSMRGIRYRW